MNGKKAKKIRRQVYGDQSLRSPRSYEADIVFTRKGARRIIRNVSTSLRALYQAAKKV